MGRLGARLDWPFLGKNYGGLFMAHSISSRDYGLLKCSLAALGGWEAAG